MYSQAHKNEWTSPPYEIIVISSMASVDIYIYIYGSRRMFPLGNSVMSEQGNISCQGPGVFTLIVIIFILLYCACVCERERDGADTVVAV